MIVANPPADVSPSPAAQWVAGTRLSQIQLELADIVDDATEFTKASSPPTADFLPLEVWVDGRSTWLN